MKKKQKNNERCKIQNKLGLATIILLMLSWVTVDIQYDLELRETEAKQKLHFDLSTRK